jgi:hypothetical protein
LVCNPFRVLSEAPDYVFSVGAWGLYFGSLARPTPCIGSSSACLIYPCHLFISESDWEHAFVRSSIYCLRFRLWGRDWHRCHLDCWTPHLCVLVIACFLSSMWALVLNLVCKSWSFSSLGVWSGPFCDSCILKIRYIEVIVPSMGEDLLLSFVCIQWEEALNLLWCLFFLQFDPYRFDCLNVCVEDVCRIWYGWYWISKFYLGGMSYDPEVLLVRLQYLQAWQSMRQPIIE